MKKVALVFVVAVLGPSLVLAWLAVRSLRDQQFLLEHQQSLLCQNVTDALAKQLETFVADRQRDFARQVEQMLDGQTARALATRFDAQLRQAWPLAEVGFAVTKDSEVLSPVVNDLPEVSAFLEANGRFIGNREAANVYFSSANTYSPAGQAVQTAEPDTAAQPASSLNLGRDRSANRADEEYNPTVLNSSTEMARKQSAAPAPNYRNVMPLQQLQQQRFNQPLAKDKEAKVQGDLQLADNYSKIAPAKAEFQELIGDATDGTVARFVNNRLSVLFWHRSARDERYVFGAQLSLPRLVTELRGLIQDAGHFAHARSWRGLSESLTSEAYLGDEICIAVLNDNARPEILTHVGFQANWKRPFVSSEISEALPHWEVAAYLLNPAQITQSAHTLKLTLGLLIAVLLLAIGVGSSLIVSDLNRQLRLARQKTDFVSNVSHELKTPLTSIRMFSELLAEQRVTDPAKQRSYLNIITAETARLTRLINNVLDFSRMERGEKKYNFRDANLVQLVRDTAESYRPHLENNGFQLDCALPEFELPVRGDTDALAQVIVNLLSNAEKYSNDPKEITVEVARRDGPLPCAEVRVLDRGLGVPRGSEEKIFEKFYRAHDSLSSGIQGSGLGLTLARQIARAHGGEVFFEARAGGGSCFSLRLPLAANPAGTDVRRL
jgi:signal transduction histidine kinase